MKRNAARIPEAANLRGRFLSRPPRDHLLARSPAAQRAIRWLEAAWSRGWCDDPPLAAEALWAKASAGYEPADEAGGRSAEDVDDFRERLVKLTDSIRQEAGLNALGRTIAHGQLVRVIRQRLALGRLWRRRPDVLKAPLAPPVLIVGQMRSGTTRLHRLLAADPRFSATRFCDSWMPVPRAPDLRRWQGALTLLLARTMNPWLDSLHPFGAARVDEELGWLAAALDHCAYEAQWRISAFSEWSEARDAGPVYAEFVRILKTDATHHGNGDRPRVMKVPQFSEDLRELARVFPEARIVVARRNEDEVAESAVSLCANQMAMQADGLSLDWLRDEVRRKIALRESRMREGIACFTGPVAEARFEDLQDDWRASIGAVYAALGLPLADAALAAMERETARAARQHHLHHRADLARMRGAAYQSPGPWAQAEASRTKRSPASFSASCPNSTV